MIERIVSGAQTGADRAALDVALELGIPCGGWIPEGRLDESGVIPPEYPGLVESDSPRPERRTWLNVRDSDGTLILSHGPLTGGSLQTRSFATELDRPCLHVDLSNSDVSRATAKARRWIDEHQVRVLNVAGPRASKDPSIYERTREVLTAMLRGDAQQGDH